MADMTLLSSWSVQHDLEEQLGEPKRSLEEILRAKGVKR